MTTAATAATATASASASSSITASVHGSTAQLVLLPGFSRALISNRRTLSAGVRCALPPQRRLESRRLVSFSVVFLQFFSLSNGASAANVMGKYVKRKRLDPLEAYIPAVILTEIQIKELGQYLEGDEPKFADCRNLLRSGPASSLRINIRAVAEYASDAGNGKYAFEEVDQCLRALEELDSLLLRASRKDSGSTVKAMKVNVDTALTALNGLLKTVPAEVLDRGKAMADAYLNPGDEDPSPQNLDPQLQKLESIL